ncbi:MAG: SDR family oxidoreductase [SAR324 cluster bacterium]|nr:SDR family oxidoreductase [SAR324 cluster bacterium]
MHVLITGAAGFIGSKLSKALAERGSLGDAAGKPVPISRITLLDVNEPQPPPDATVEIRPQAGDIRDPDQLRRALTRDTKAVFHLAAVVSGQAEADFDLGMGINLDGTRTLLDACRELPEPPKLVFPSSVAVFGGEMPEVIRDDTLATPRTSYGAQKAICELMINDYTRKGFVDGRVMRLPTISVRPGKPNQAASTFASSILREPLQGEQAVCPVPVETGIWIMSPRRVIAALLHGCDLAAAMWGEQRILNLAGLTVTVREMLAAMERAAGTEALQRVRMEPDQQITRIITGWPARFDSQRALGLGFQADADMDEVLRIFLEDDRITPGA